MTLDLTKPVQTRDGKKARIVCTDAKGKTYKVIALVEIDGEEEAHSYTLDGWFREEAAGGDLDLVNVPEATYRWMNVYKGNHVGAACQSREEADKVARLHHRNRVSIVQIKMVDDRVTDAIIHDM